jgi:hypothetical protein
MMIMSAGFADADARSETRGTAGEPVNARFEPARAESAGDGTYALTMTHFLAALGFLAAAAAGLVWVAPELAAGRYLDPRAAATAHLFTLGWITTSIMGALYQLFPVALGAPVRWRWLAWLTLVLHAPGLLLFVGGLTAGHRLALLSGAALFGVGLVCFAVNAAGTLQRSRERDLTWWALAFAVFFLLATVAFGASLALNLFSFHLGAERLTALGVHVHVALGGWVMLVMLGVGRKLLPMFLLSQGVREAPARWAFGLLTAGCLLLTVFHAYAGAWLLRAAGALLACGTLALLVHARSHFAGRRRPVLDPGMRLAGAGLAFLAAATVLGVLVGLFPTPRLVTGYGFALVAGAFTLFVAGHYYKIVPFLVWHRRYGGSAGRTRVPSIAELYDGRIAGVAAALLAAAAAAMLAAVLFRSAFVAVAAAGLFAGGVTIFSTQMIALIKGGRHERSG